MTTIFNFSWARAANGLRARHKRNNTIFLFIDRIALSSLWFLIVWNSCTPNLFNNTSTQFFGRSGTHCRDHTDGKHSGAVKPAAADPSIFVTCTLQRRSAGLRGQYATEQESKKDRLRSEIHTKGLLKRRPLSEKRQFVLPPLRSRRSPSRSE